MLNQFFFLKKFISFSFISTGQKSIIDDISLERLTKDLMYPYAPIDAILWKPNFCNTCNTCCFEIYKLSFFTG